jgi:hypothetical protein
MYTEWCAEINAREGRGIKGKGKAWLDDEERVGEKKTAHVAGGDHTLANAHTERVERGHVRVNRPSPLPMLIVPTGNEGPLTQREESTRRGTQGIIVEHQANGRWVTVA